MALIYKQTNVFARLLFMWFVVVFVISALLVNLLQLVVLPLYWLKLNWYHYFIEKLSYCIFSEMTILGEWWGSIDFRMYANEEVIHHLKKKKAIVIINHYSDIDWLIGWIFAERVGILGHEKVFAKDGLQYVPTLGWAFWFAEYIFLKRNWRSDHSSIIKGLSALKRQCNPYMLILFCEGTRRTDAKLLASQEFAKKNNIVPLKYHLLPRTKGFVLAVQELKDDAQMILNLEIGFPDIESATISNLINRGRIEVHLYARYIPISAVSSMSDDQVSAFCHEMYREKDHLMEYFESNRKFPGPETTISRKTLNLKTFIASNILVAVLVLTWFIYCTNRFGSQFIAIFIPLFCLLVLWVYQLLLKITRTDKGSSFGLKNRENKKEE